MTDAFSASALWQLNRDTCDAVVNTGRPPDTRTKAADFIIRRWQYPMYDLDLGLVRVRQAELESRRLNSYLCEFDDDAPAARQAMECGGVLRPLALSASEARALTPMWDSGSDESQ